MQRTAAGIEPAAARATRPRRRRGALLVYAVILPIFAVIAMFEYYPALSGMFFSLFDWKPAGESVFVGLDNYAAMIRDAVWLQSFRNLGVIFLFGIATWLVPLTIAELLISLRSVRAQSIFRVLFIVPMAFPGVVTALVWSFIYHPNHGALNRLLEAIGLGHLAQNWVGDPNIALASLLFIGFPFIAGLPFLVFYSGLKNIPPEVFEAAQLDGVGRLRRIVSIDLPLLAGQFRILLFLAIVSTLQYGFVAFVVTSGGPDNATMVPVLRMLNVAFQGGDWGYATTLATTLFLLTAAFSTLVAVIRRRDSVVDVKGL